MKMPPSNPKNVNGRKIFNLIFMKKVQVLFFMLAVVSIAFTSCKKNESSSNNNSNASQFSDLNGTWTGTATMVKKGSCDVSGNPTYNVSQNWTVDNNGKVNIVETVSSQSFKWEGTIDNNNNISITNNTTATCNGSSTSRIYTLQGKIIKNGNNYTLTSIVDYPLCPPDCLFNLNYSLSK